MAGIRFDGDPPDWFAGQALAKPMLLAFYKEGSPDEGQRQLRRSLERMKILTPEKPLPKIGKIPADLHGVLALIQKLELTPEELPHGKPAKPAAIAKAKAKLKIPAGLLALYKVYDGIGGEIVPVAGLAALQKDFQKEIKALLKEGPEDENFNKDEIDIRTLLPLANFLAISETSSGDYLFLHAKAKTVNGNSPVLRYCHDQSFVCKIEAESLPFLAARIFVRRWAELNGSEKQLFKVLYPNLRLAKAKKKP